MPQRYDNLQSTRFKRISGVLARLSSLLAARLTVSPTDRRLANLRPFKKGQSGNPAGRMKIPPDVKEMARGLTTEAIGQGAANISAAASCAGTPRRRRLRKLFACITRATTIGCGSWLPNGLSSSVGQAPAVRPRR